MMDEVVYWGLIVISALLLALMAAAGTGKLLGF